MGSTSEVEQGIAKRLMLAREAAGLSFSQAAAELGVTPAMVKRWEAAKLAPTPEQWRDLCLVYGELPCYFFFGDGMMTADALDVLRMRRYWQPEARRSESD